MLVKDVMHRAVCIDPQESLAAAARKLRDEHVGCLAVCRGAQVLGVLTDRDIVVRSAAQRRDPGEMTVREAMSVGALCYAHNDTAESAAGLMQRRHVRRLIVLDAHSHVIGVVSATDVGLGNLGGWVSRPPPCEVVFYKDCLGYWASDMGVDGFRFDLASILGRDENGRLMANAPLLERIAEDPVLRGIKLIAEAWDAAGAYQVGCFAGARWAEWNGRFRDDVRRFWRGDTGMAGSFAMRLCGSADLYERSGKAPSTASTSSLPMTD